jgi:heme/copper-type cytochrome/quinol oxidase subunit 3
MFMLGIYNNLLQRIQALVYSPILLQSIHMEVSTAPFALLSTTPWAMLFALCIVLSTLSICQVYMFKGIYFSFSFIMVFALVFIGVVVSMHYWFRDLVRDLAKKYEIILISLFLVFFIFVASEALLFVSFFWASFHSTLSPTLCTYVLEGFYLPDPTELTFANTLLLSNAAVSLCCAFVALETSNQYIILPTGLAFFLSVLFISLQIKEFRVFSTHLNDSVFSSCFFYITGLHFFHLLVGLFISCLFFWASSFPSKGHFLSQVRVSEIHLFYNLQLFYWHFIEILWIFIFLVFYRFFLLVSSLRSHPSYFGSYLYCISFTFHKKMGSCYYSLVHLVVNNISQSSKHLLKLVFA